MADSQGFQITGAAGETVRGYVHAPSGAAKVPAVLLAHGFKGFADYGFLPLTAERLAAAGMAVVRFSFSHCGIAGSDGDRFDRSDLFERDTYGNQIADILALVEAVRAGRLPRPGRMDAERMAIIGHSRGGVAAILATGHTIAFKAVITLAGPDQVIPDEMLAQQIRVFGRVASPSGRTGQELYVGRACVDDIDAAGDRYDLAALLGRFEGAFLAVHCQGDETVPVACSERLAAAHTAGPTELEIFPAGGHTFDFKHGQSGSTPMLDAATAKVIGFLQAHLI